MESKSGGNGGDDFGVHEIAPDTLVFMPPKGSEKKPYIISKRSSTFVQFCLLAEALIETRDRLVRTYSPQPQHSDSDSDSDSDDGTFAFGVLNNNHDTERPDDPEMGSVHAHPDDRVHATEMTEMTGVASIGAGTVVQPTEFVTGIRNRAVSPERGETWTIDLQSALAPPLPPPPRVRTTHSFGDANYSAVVRMLPASNGTVQIERNQYCRIDHIELWSAYRVFMVFKEEDGGLMRAIQSGAIDLTTDAQELDKEATCKRVNDWREGYAEVLNTYNTTVDTFVAKAGVYLAMAGDKGDAHAAALARMADAVGVAKAELLPKVDNETNAAGVNGIVDDGNV